jgi:hypothetical protein
MKYIMQKQSYMNASPLNDMKQNEAITGEEQNRLKKIMNELIY